MGLFSSIKNLFSKKKEIEETEIELPKENEEIEEVEEFEEEVEQEIEEEEIEQEVEEEVEEEEIVKDIDEEEVEEIKQEVIYEVKDNKKEKKKKEKKNKIELTQKELIEEKEKIEKYDKGLEKSRKEFVSNLSMLGIKYNKVSEEYFEELEQILIMADIGVNTVFKFMDEIKSRVKKENIVDTKYLNEVIVDELFIIYVNGENLSDKINMAENGPTVILMVGVNGVGKTTTIAKLAYKYKALGKKVMMIAGDTFRAGAVEQLKIWAERTDSLFYGKENIDPAGVIYDGLEQAKEANVDIVLVDTAGRLQNKVNLMKELEKINKVIDKIIPSAPHETLLVIDASTGQNGILQAKSFKEITNITGIVLTKMDGTAKGGIVLAIKEEVGLPVKFIGLGEAMTDLETFDIENYIYGLFKDLITDEE